jgi:serine/threonine protein kinase
MKLKFFKKVNTKNKEFQPDPSIYPYTDPKVFKLNELPRLDKKSDVYSVGVLLWEISSGKSPFGDNYTIELCMQILSGRREQIIPNTPIYYSKLYTGKYN